MPAVQFYSANDDVPEWMFWIDANVPVRHLRFSVDCAVICTDSRYIVVPLVPGGRSVLDMESIGPDGRGRIRSDREVAVAHQFEVHN
jgi:hypothetical protein